MHESRRVGSYGEARGGGNIRRVVDCLREAFPRARLMVLLDGEFACPEVLDFLDEQPRLDYILPIARNKVL